MRWRRGRSKMSISFEIKNLASLVTFRQLYDDGKNDIYFIVSQFVEAIIVNSSLYSFSITELSREIKRQFGFNIPDYVIQSSLKRVDCVTKKNHQFIVDANKLSACKFNEQFQGAFEKNNILVGELYDFFEERYGTISEENKNLLTEEFCSFLLNGSSENNFSDIISAFIIEREDNLEIVNHIRAIKEGAVLYTGINSSSNISERGSWKVPLTIYVEIEILFHLAGYNGEVFKKLADDLFSLISEMNSKSIKRPIKIRYFEEVMDEIEKFFKKAENIVAGKEILSIDNYAMNTIVKGCKKASDVIEKKSTFFSMLKAKGILQADPYDYYSDNNYEYNLESLESIQRYGLTEDKIRYIQHINYVNILRQGEDINDLKRCKHVILTEVGKILYISSDISHQKVPLAINMGMLTNRLWFDLNKGFGAREFPSNFDIILKSKIVLSSLLTETVSEKYEQAYREFKSEKINMEQMEDFILRLREEVKKPEDINQDSVENVLEFITEKELNIYQSEKERLDFTVKKREEEIDEYKKILKEKESDIALNEELLIKERKEKLQSYICTKESADNEIKKRMTRFDILLKICGTIYYLGIIALFFFLDEPRKNYFLGVLAVLPPAISGIIALITNKPIGFLEGVQFIKQNRKKKIERKVYKMFDIDLNKLQNIQSELNKMNRN